MINSMKNLPAWVKLLIVCILCVLLVGLVLFIIDYISD